MQRIERVDRFEFDVCRSWLPTLAQVGKWRGETAIARRGANQPEAADKCRDDAESLGQLVPRCGRGVESPEVHPGADRQNTRKCKGDFG